MGCFLIAETSKIHKEATAMLLMVVSPDGANLSAEKQLASGCVEKDQPAECKG